MVDIPLGTAIEAQSNPTISSTDVPATLSTVLISANAEPNTEAPGKDPPNLELCNEATTPQTEEKLPFIDTGSYVARDIDFGKQVF